jgi:K+-sensing histidine kinase KdpD
VQRAISYIPRGVRPFWRGQAIALAAAIVAVVIRAAIDPFVHDGLYFTFLFPAVFVAGLFGGTLAGITTAVVGGTVIAYVWVPPALSFRLHSDGIIRLVAFCFSAGLTLVLTSFVHRVLDKLAAAEKQAATLAGEMHHRLQNTLTLVQAIARQAFRNASTLQEARAILMERLAALARFWLKTSGDCIPGGQGRRSGLVRAGRCPMQNDLSHFRSRGLSSALRVYR